jgi:hypothetical protein
MKLTDDDVRVMRSIFAAGYTAGLIRILAREFGVTAWYCSRVVRGVAR